jgi:hypothetical protein
MIFEELSPIKSVELSAIDGMPEGLLDAAAPLVIKNFLEHWPLVQAARQGAETIQQLLIQHYNNQPVHLMYADETVKGRLFYNDDLTGFNFTRSQVALNAVFKDINAVEGLECPPTYYVGSTAIDHTFPGLRTQNDLTFLADKALASIWMGNQSRISAHYDAPDNIACVVAGKRRFTLFPPEQISNLYIGPIDFTPAGQPASLVDFHAPDFEKYPRFKQALKHAQVAELSAGDAIYIPANWWHHIEAMDKFNVLINYWWRQVDDHIGVPNDALLHAMLAIRELPVAQRQAWQHIFDYYIFNPQKQSHIPEHALGVLSETDPLIARKLRAMLMNSLNR